MLKDSSACCIKMVEEEKRQGFSTCDESEEVLSASTSASCLKATVCDTGWQMFLNPKVLKNTNIIRLLAPKSNFLIV